MSFRDIIKFEELPPQMARRIAESAWPIFTGKIDVAAGCGQIAPDTKCVWTTDGRRVEVSFGGGALIISQSKDVDPVYAERKGVKGNG